VLHVAAVVLLLHWQAALRSSAGMVPKPVDLRAAKTRRTRPSATKLRCGGVDGTVEEDLLLVNYTATHEEYHLRSLTSII
jgi:hypothetical protein